jgi:hemerythrin-like domain-containing protein
LAGRPYLTGMDKTSPLWLPNRVGKLPPDISCLREKYPRETWDEHRNFGQTAQFWLQMHDMFRELGGMLKTATASFREGEMDPGEFHRFFTPRLNYFLSHLQGHHEIEDYSYFPLFRSKDQRLIVGFDLLENDHVVIHELLIASAETGQQLVEALHAEGDARRYAADAYSENADRMLDWLIRHLDDEEDLVVPAILEHSEQELFGR